MLMAKSEEYFEDVVTELDDPTAIVYIRDDQGRYVYVNDNFGDMLPFTREQVLGKTNRELFGEEAAQSWEATDSLTTASGSHTVTEESLFDKRTKKWRKFISTKSILVDDDGVRYLAGISVEIKDRRALEYERRLANLRARLLRVIQEHE